MNAAEVNAERYAQHPHGDAADNHRIFYIAGSTHTIGRNKGKCPYERLYDRDGSEHIQTHLSAFRFHAAKDGYHSAGCKDEPAADNDYDFTDTGKFFNIVDGFIIPSCTDTLADDGHQSNADADGCDTI